jgi:hypothetical protein
MIINIIDAKYIEYNSYTEFYSIHYNNNSLFFNSEYFNWFYLDNPISSSLSVNAYYNNEIVGNMFLNPIQFIKSNKIINGCFVTDVLTHPSHGDKNIFVKLIRKAIEYTKSNDLVLCGYPNKKAMPGWKRTKMNFYKPLDTYMTKPVVLKKHKTSLIYNLQDINNFIHDYYRTCDHNILNIYTSFEYIQWKYLNNPTKKKYYIKSLEDSNNIVGILIYYKKYNFLNRVVHFICNDNYVNILLGSSFIPYIVTISSELEKYSVVNSIYKFKKITDYFLTDFQDNHKLVDMTLASSDL